MNTMELINRFKAYIVAEKLYRPGDKVLLAVSGGVDSVVMAHLYKQAGIDCAIAHCNFQLRGAESIRDETFVTALAHELGLPLYTTRFDTEAYASEKRVSIQVAARELRYAWLEETRQQQGYTFLATAHHMQDNVETVLMNFSKGTGIAGLHGILPRQQHLIRPLLFAQKEDLVALAAVNGWGFVEDSSNLTVKYTRNFFRHKVIPVIQETYPAAVPQMAASIDRFREAEQLYTEAVLKHKKRLLFEQGESFKVPVLKLQKATPLQTLAWEIFKDFGCSPAQLPQVIDLLQSEPGRLVETSTHRIIRDRVWLLITPLEAPEAPLIVIEKETAVVPVKGGTLKLKIRNSEGATIPTSPLMACLDMDTLQFPLLMRRWKQGDYFYPLGMRKKKKLSRFFIDQKLSLIQKENMWVLESAKRIVWIIGMRIDDRCKITPHTSNMLVLEWQPI
ncbi:tRNA lysidine(34) synthetase TilS [Chitinophaga sp.]|uniref:tRNA lysidine(34) synthetase TilS n=1 Tax=Chitinophaga sp. TaxID=1869181 RepID=UPI0031CDCD19